MIKKKLCSHLLWMMLVALASPIMIHNVSAEAVTTSTAIPERHDVPSQYQWHLNDIYESDASWQSDLDKIKGDLLKIIQYKGKLAASSAQLLQCLKLRDQIGITSDKVSAYAQLHRDENTANNKYQELVGKVEALSTEASVAMAFIEPEILAIPDEKLAAFRQQQVELDEYSFSFSELARQKKHILPLAEEEILSRSSQAMQSAQNAFDMLAHADMRFPEITDASGNKVELSEGRYYSYISSPDRDVRKQSFQALYATYNQYRNTFAATLGGNVKADVFYAKTRKYDSALEAALASDNVPLHVYDNVITTVHKNLAPLHRYVTLKKKLLAVDDLHMYDLYASVAGDKELRYEYNEGLRLVKAATAPLGAEYAAILSKGLSSGWVDSYENKGKQTGAYSEGVYGVHPFVLLNYQKKYQDVSTIAHEMGHAIHSYYSQANQPYATSQYTIFCAEVASTTNEVLLNDYMLKTVTDKQIRRHLLEQYLETIRTTIYRQTMFAEFEKIIADKVEKGNTLTADALDAIWHELNVKYYGPEMVVDKESDVEWARIPHFYSMFYVYKYVTGYSAATALAEQVQTEGDLAQQRYINFLKSGGSNYSIELLKGAGVDMSSPKPLEVTLQKFSRLLDELETLVKERDTDI